MTLCSMTGFARIDGSDASATWHWELRSVNGRGLDVRLRLPNGAERLEVQARERVAKHLKRGNVSLSLTQQRSVETSEIKLNETALDQVLRASEQVRARIDAPPPTVEGLLALRGVLEVSDNDESEEIVAGRTAAQLTDLDSALSALVDMRRSEGRRLGDLVRDQLVRIADLVEQIAASPARTPEVITSRIRALVERIRDDHAAEFDPARLHQEAVLLAAKADIEEELQRLRVHIDAARELLQSGEAVGRRLDFLTQEFNREANTICSKSNESEVTRLGLDLKSVIEQMREQVQNIE